MAAASLLETISNTKLAASLGFSLVLVLTAALLGGYVAPDPMGHQSHLVRYCDTSGKPDNSIVDTNSCPKEIRGLDDAGDMYASSLVMFTQFAHANSGLSMSRWFQFLASSMSLELNDQSEHQYHAGAKLSFEAILAYKTNLSDPEWTVMAESLQEWDFNCQREHGTWQCDQINFFELGSCHHAAYLINLRLPVHKRKNSMIGTLSDVWITTVYQNGGFTKVMLAIRSTFFQLSITLFIFYLYRVYHSSGSVTLLQKAVGSLGFSLVVLNFPTETISLYHNLPGLLIWSDIRQGAFYAFLMLFLIVFMGEHSGENKEKSWKAYKYPIFFTGITSGCLLVFDLSERGRQLYDPFHSVWSNKNSRWWGMFFISSAVFMFALDIIYLLYLTYTAISALRNKIYKMTDMSAARRNHYKRALRRVAGVCTATVVVALASVILFAVMHYSEVNKRWDEVQTVNMNSASYLSLYAVANVYALNLLLLYSPAYLKEDVCDEDDDDVAENKKLVSNGPTVFQLAAKQSQD